MSTADKTCDICNTTCNQFYVDGATRIGPWANMCLTCHACHGRGLGTGKGQKYQRQPDKTWKQVKA